MAEGKNVENVAIVTKSKRKVYAFGLFTLVVVVVMVVFAIAPSVTTIIDLSDQLDDKEATLKTLETKVNTLNNLSTDYENMGSIIEDLDLLFPTTGDSSLFMANINKICDENGYEMTSVSFDDASDYEVGLSVLVPYSVRVSVKGQKSRVNYLLVAIEDMPTYPEVKNFSFSNKADDNGDYGFSIEMYTYVINDPLFFE